MEAQSLDIIRKLLERSEINKKTGCLEWKGAGYPFHGRIRWGNRMIGPHRAAWTALNGAIPKGKVLCHRCDNPPCWLPSHLFLGSYKDNSRDMVQKGRAAYGERQGLSKLSDDTVRAIRAEVGGLRSIAKKYGISKSCAHQVRSGKTWRHLL